MDFFGAQAKARRNSLWLTLGLVLATLSISVFLYFIFHVPYLAFTKYSISNIPHLAFTKYDAIENIIIFSVLAGCGMALHDPIRFPAAGHIGAFFGFFAALIWLISKNEWLDIGVLAWTTAVVMGIVALGSVYKIRQIARQGMGTIIRRLGAVQIARNTRDIAEKRLLNVVDEVSIAASMIPPKVFLLGREDGINAFAGGLDDRDNAIVVTRGALEHLSRDELQAVIAHETSHIVNGDARFNLKLIGWLHGVMMFSGDRVRTLFWNLMFICFALPFLYVLLALLFDLLDFPKDNIYGFLFSRSSGAVIINTAPVIIFLVFIFMPVHIPGTIGVYSARFIKAAISREREFLADAAAVQYTRNPDALARALLKIEQFGSRIRVRGAEVFSHMFFSHCIQGARFWGNWFNTHPEVPERIERLSSSAQRPPNSRSSRNVPQNTPATTAAVVATLSLASAKNLMAALPQSLFAAIVTAAGAKATAYALFISAHEDVQAQQLETIRKAHTSALAKASLNRAGWLFAHDRRYRLIVLDLALPALRAMALADRLHLLECVDALALADGRLSASEFALKHLLRHILAPAPAPAPARLRPRLRQMDADIAILLALLAYAGNADEDSVRAAYHRARDIAPMNRAWPLPEKQALHPKAIEAALSHLGQAGHPFRVRCLQACIAAVGHDGQITTTESEMLRAFAQSLDCPVQQLLPKNPAKA